MESKLKLNDIFRFLFDNPNFMLRKVGCTNLDNETVNRNDDTEIISSLQPCEIRNFDSFTDFMKQYIPKDYFRYGIDYLAVNSSSLISINKSFMKSMQIILRPILSQHQLDDITKDYEKLENLIFHKILKNSYHVDKKRNLKKVSANNKLLVENIKNGEMNDEIIQIIVNMFEINLFILDIVNEKAYFFWVKGIKCPHLNFFKNIYFMTKIDDVYEPIISMNKIEENIKRSIFKKILFDKNIIFFEPLSIFFLSYEYIFSWNNITNEEFVYFVEKYILDDFEKSENLN